MKRSSQDGYAMLAVLLFLGVVVIGLAAAVPAWHVAIQRQREAREIDYGREYRTAVRRYFHKNGRYPPSLDALTQKDGNGIRYLRQPFADPLMLQGTTADSGANATGAGWDVIHFGQAVAAEIVDQPPQAAAGAGGISAGGSPGLPGLTQGSAPTGGAGGGSGSTPGSTPGPGGIGTAPGGTTGLVNGSGAGGGPVIGVASLSKKPGVHSFNGFDLPNQWQFVYNYTQDPTLRTGGTPGRSGVPLPPGAPGTPGSRPGAPGPIGGGTTGPGHSIF